MFRLRRKAMFTNTQNVIVTNVSSITIKQGFKQKLVEPLTLMIKRQRIETKSFCSLIFNSSYFVRNLPTTTRDVYSLFVRLFGPNCNTQPDAAVIHEI